MAATHPAATRRRSSLQQARGALAARLLVRRPEIEESVAARVYAISSPSETADPDYLEGLRSALTTAIDYALAAAELGEERAPAVPPSLLAQARMAARNSVGLDTVLRRYLAGYSLLSEFIIGEAEGGGLTGGSELQRLLRGQAAIFDRLLAAVSEEYAREARERPGTSEQRRAERIERLLSGEVIDTSGLGYDFEGAHVGLVCSGSDGADLLRGLSTAFDCRLLLLPRGDGTVWGWLGSRRPFDSGDLGRHIETALPSGFNLAIGEPGEGLAGWRLTHRQARSALQIASRSGDPLVRYADVALLASVLQDELLCTSLRQLYLIPLESDRDGGKAARETLRAYFDADRNVSSAAAVLGTKRHTVTHRLRAIERRIGRTLTECSVELEVASSLEQLEPSP